jgi:hypothetical protein
LSAQEACFFGIIGGMNQEKVSFLPFNAINEFMLVEYRQSVIQDVLSHLDLVNADTRRDLIQMIKDLVQVSGFRNSAQAPLPLKVKGAINAFQKSADFCGTTLQAWSEIHKDLREHVYKLLKGRDWEILPAETNRAKITGFLTVWPKNETYEVLEAGFHEQVENSEQFVDDDIRLMLVWVSGRLPYDLMTGEENESVEESAE